MTHIIHYLHPVTEGGGEHLLGELLKESRRSRDDKFGVILGCKNDYLENFCKRNEIGVDVVTIFNSKQQYSKVLVIWRAVFQIIYVFFALKKQRPDVVHFHSFPFQYFGVILRTWMLLWGKKVRCGFTKHIYSERGTASRMLWRVGTRSLDFVTAVSRSALHGVGLSENEICRVIYNPADAVFFEQKYVVREDGIIRACIGSRLATDKGHAELLSHLARSDFAGVKLILEIFGSGPLEGTIRSDAKAAMRSNPNLEVIFTGMLDRQTLITRLVQVDFAFHPSINEGFSLMCAQLHVLGIPTLCRDYGPSHEVFQENAAYYSNQESFQAALNMMFESKYRQAISQRLLAKRDKFRIEEIEAQYHELYRA